MLEPLSMLAALTTAQSPVIKKPRRKQKPGVDTSLTSDGSPQQPSQQSSHPQPSASQSQSQQSQSLPPLTAFIPGLPQIRNKLEQREPSPPRQGKRLPVPEPPPGPLPTPVLPVPPVGQSSSQLLSSSLPVQPSPSSSVSLPSSVTASLQPPVVGRSLSMQGLVMPGVGRSVSSSAMGVPDQWRCFVSIEERQGVRRKLKEAYQRHCPNYDSLLEMVAAIDEELIFSSAVTRLEYLRTGIADWDKKLALKKKQLEGGFQIGLVPEKRKAAPAPLSPSDLLASSSLGSSGNLPPVSMGGNPSGSFDVVSSIRTDDAALSAAHNGNPSLNAPPALEPAPEAQEENVKRRRTR